MITTPTVLVLGAGASMPFGFPSGNGLAEFLSTFGTLQDLKECGFREDQIVDFREQLKRSGKSSVDAFLEYRPEFLDVGKAAIAYKLISHEDPTSPIAFQDNWYRYLYERMDASLDKFSENKLAVITFNYDRSLEFFLFTALKNSYGASDPEVASALAQIPIVHVHGQLGLLEWQSEKFGVTTRREFGTFVNRDTIQSAAAGIRIVHEIGDTHLEPFKQAVQLLQSANRIVFLGFGYNSVNLSRLRMGEVLTSVKPDVDSGRTKIAGSFFGFTQAEIAHITVSQFQQMISTGAPHFGVIDFLRHTGILLTP